MAPGFISWLVLLLNQEMMGSCVEHIIPDRVNTPTLSSSDVGHKMSTYYYLYNPLVALEFCNNSGNVGLFFSKCKGEM